MWSSADANSNSYKIIILITCDQSLPYIGAKLALAHVDSAYNKVLVVS